jgi:hypothetical protein
MLLLTVELCEDGEYALDLLDRYTHPTLEFLGMQLSFQWVSLAMLCKATSSLTHRSILSSIMLNVSVFILILILRSTVPSALPGVFVLRLRELLVFARE